eukprot:scpid93429/ scgid10434/ 
MLANKTCSIMDVGEDILVLLRVVLRNELSNCQKIVEWRRTWKENLWCTVVAYRIFRLNYLENKYLSPVARQNARLMLNASQYLNAAVYDSRNTVEKCNLKNASPQLYCGNSSGPFACT